MQDVPIQLYVHLCVGEGGRGGGEGKGPGGKNWECVCVLVPNLPLQAMFIG